MCTLDWVSRKDVIEMVDLNQDMEEVKEQAGTSLGKVIPGRGIASTKLL